MNERQHFEILLIEVMEMETVSVQQLQQQFCMDFNQAVRFMEYLSTHQMLEETLTLTVSRQFKSFTSQFQFLGINPDIHTLSDLREARLSRQEMIESSKAYFDQLRLGERIK